MCQILSLFKIEFRNNKINFAGEDGRQESGELQRHKANQNCK